MERSRLGIVIPAYNEAATIASVVQGVKDLGQPIVVNDNSSDETAELAGNAGAVVVSHEQNKGYDQALDSGFQQAEKIGCEYVVTMDADGQHDPSILGIYINEMDNGTDMVLGVRDRRQRIAEHVFAWIAGLLWGIDDPLCGMKGYRMDVYRKLGHFDSYGSIGTELAIYGVRSGYSFVQVPVATRDRRGESRFGRAIKGNYLILRAAMLSFFLIRPVKA